MRLSSVPLRLRLVGTVVVLCGLGLALSGVAATASLRGYLLSRVDDQLASAVNHVAQEPAGQSRPDHDPLGSTFAEVITSTGTTVTQLRTGLSAPALPTDLSARGAFTVDALDGKHQWRVLATSDKDGTVVVAVPLDDVGATTSRLLLLEIAVGAGVLVLLAGVGYVVVRRSLRPLVAVERTAEAIATGDLTRRVAESDPRTEVGSLALSLNAMLGQIEEAFGEREASEAAARASEDRMRRFVGDASHELRTPLTSIRGFAELYRQGALTASADVDRAMSRVEDEATRMGALVDDLLLLARLDQQRPLERAVVDLVALCADTVHDAQAADPERQLSLVADVATCQVEGDRHRLTQVITNLLVNARTHTPEGTQVRLHLGVVRGQALLEVADSGPGIPADERARVFDRFYRADSSRTRASGGSGLGLAIVAGIVAAHGGSVQVLETPGGGATFHVRLPLIEPSTVAVRRAPRTGQVSMRNR